MRLCSGAGCGRAVADAVRFCDACKAEPVNQLSQVNQPTDGIRTHTSGYDAELDRLRKGQRWQRTRTIVARRDPFCRRCDVRVTDEVDHIVPAREAIAQAQLSGRFPGDRYAGYYLQSNLQGLCRSCHIQKTIEDKTHTGPWPDVVAAEDASPKRRFTF